MTALLSFFRLGAALPPPYPNPATRYKHWYHGTQFDYNNDSDVRPGGTIRHQLAYDTEYGEKADRHWNTDLGTHFAADYGIASKFARPHGATPSSRIAHVALHMANPKHYDSEFDMTGEAIDWAHQHGYHMFSDATRERGRKAHDDIAQGVRPSEMETEEDAPERVEHLDEMEPTKLSAHLDIDSGHRHEYYDHQADEYLAEHPDRDEIVQGFKEHLRSQGHDGVIYGNEYERDYAGGTSLCAIPFDDHQVNMHRWEWLDPKRKDHEHKVEERPDPEQRHLVQPSYTPDKGEHWRGPEGEHLGPMHSLLMAHFAAVWENPKPKWPGQSWHDVVAERGEDGAMAWADERRQEESTWTHETRKAISRGDLTPQQAWNNGYKGQGHDQTSEGAAFEDTQHHGLSWKPMSGPLWHVTTDKPAVLAEGLKSRKELGQRSGLGLGGGDDDTVSLTDDPKVAHQILDAMHEYHHHINDPQAIAKMHEEARRGGWHQPVLDTELGSGGDQEQRLNHVLNGRSPYGDPEDEDRQIQRRSAWYKTHAWHRDWAGGKPTPGFMMNDPAAFAKADPSKFGIVRVHPKPGAHGYQVSALGEWRTADGSSLHVADEPTQKRAGKTGATQEPYLHYSNVLFEPGDTVLPISQIPGKRSPYDGANPHYSPDHVYLFRAGEVPKDFRAQGGALYEVHPHGEVEQDPEPYRKRGPTPGSYRTTGPVTVTRMISNNWYDPRENIPAGLRGPGWKPSEQPRPHRPKTASTPGYLDNPYHDHQEWFHGSRKSFDGAPDPNHKRDTEEAERAAHGHLASSQFNQLLGTHFSSLHQVAHEFAGEYSADDSRVFHARLKMPNPVHFPDEASILHHVWRWASSQHPDALHDENHDDNMAFQYGKGVTMQGIDRRMEVYRRAKRSGSLTQAMDHRTHSSIASSIETHLQWHPQAHGIARAYVQHLKDAGYTGMTYGNVVEGPKHHICAIATDPDQIEITHVDRMHSPALDDQKERERKYLPVDTVSHDHIRSIHDEPEDMLDEVERYHNGGMLRSDPGFYTSQSPWGNTGRGEYKYSSKQAGKIPVYRGLYLADDPETYEGTVRRSFDHREPLGSHWSSDPEVAKAFALDFLHGTGGAGMVLHGAVDEDDVVDRKDIDPDQGVMSPTHFEREVHVRPGAPVDIHKSVVHWHHPEDEEHDDWYDEASEHHDPPLRAHASGQPTAHYRWMHYGEYEAARDAGHFRFGINAAMDAPDNRYQAGDHMLVRFPHSETWEPKEDGSGNPYSRSRGEVPFEDAEVLQTNPMCPERVPGPRPVKNEGGRWQPAYVHKNAGLNGDLPEGMTFTVHYRHPEHPRIRMNDGEAWAFAHHEGKNIAGLRWNYHEEPSTVRDITVSPAYQRRGVATALFNWVKQNHQSDLEHSDVLTDDGRAFRQSFGMGAAGPDYDNLTFSVHPSPQPGQPHRKVLAARHPEHGFIGHLHFTPWSGQVTSEDLNDDVTHLQVHLLQTDAPHQRRGVASALMRHLESWGVPIDHGERTVDGEEWARHQYGQHGDPSDAPDDEMNVRGRWTKDGKPWDPVAEQTMDRFGSVLTDWKPTERLFAPTKGTVDPRLFDPERQMHPDIREEILEKVGTFFTDHGYGDMREGWARVYLAGSQASEWWGNNDFDILVGINYPRFREAHPDLKGLSDAEIGHRINRDFQHDFNDEQWHPGFDPEHEWHLTGYVFLPPKVYQESKLRHILGACLPRSNSLPSKPSDSLPSTEMRDTPRPISQKTSGSTSSPSRGTSILPGFPAIPAEGAVPTTSGKQSRVGSAEGPWVFAQDVARSAREKRIGSTTSPARWGSRSSSMTPPSSGKGASAPSAESPASGSRWTTTTTAVQAARRAASASGDSFAPVVTEPSAFLAKTTLNEPSPMSGGYDSWDIRDIKPYAAYNITDDTWAVDPIHEPTGHQFAPTEWYYFEGVAEQIRRALSMREPIRSQRCEQIWSFVHSDRSRAFGPHGTGAFDRGNALEKYLSQAPYGDSTLMDELRKVKYGQ